jgi:hypothetical protein
MRTLFIVSAIAVFAAAVSGAAPADGRDRSAADAEARAAQVY